MFLYGRDLLRLCMGSYCIIITKSYIVEEGRRRRGRWERGGLDGYSGLFYSSPVLPNYLFFLVITQRRHGRHYGVWLVLCAIYRLFTPPLVPEKHRIWI